MDQDFLKFLALLHQEQTLIINYSAIVHSTQPYSLLEKKIIEKVVMKKEINIKNISVFLMRSFKNK